MAAKKKKKKKRGGHKKKIEEIPVRVTILFIIRVISEVVEKSFSWAALFDIYLDDNALDLNCILFLKIWSGVQSTIGCWNV